MLNIIPCLIKFLLNLFRSNKDLIIENLLLKKEIEILQRKKKGPVRTNYQDRVFFLILNKVVNIKTMLNIVQPDTLLAWQREIIKKRWRFPPKRRPGRPPINREVKLLVLEMKNSNPMWGAKRIRDELFKTGTGIHKTTVRNILRELRKQGKIRSTLTWKKFLQSQIGLIYAMDFLTVDTIRGMRFYVYFIIEHQSRRIVQFAVTENPVKEFVRQQLILFKESVSGNTYMIHDGTGEFYQNYASLGVKNIRTSFRSPNMNAIAERFIGTLRREALDYFFIFNRKQLYRILDEYIGFYNARRPHQGLDQNSPLGYEVEKDGIIGKRKVLSGLITDYYRYRGVPME